MSVGGGAVFDDTGQTDRLACGLPAISGYAVTPAAIEADLVDPADAEPGQRAARRRRSGTCSTRRSPRPKDAVGVFTGAIDDDQARRDAQQGSARRSWAAKIVYDGTYNPQSVRRAWRPFIEPMRNTGVKGLYWVGEPANLSSFLTRSGEPRHQVRLGRRATRTTTTRRSSTSGAAADGVYMRTAFYPFLDPAPRRRTRRPSSTSTS